MPREPQSYGSGSDWVSGKTDQQVNEQKSVPAPEHADFYDDRRESEETGSAQRGKTSDVQLAENDERGGNATAPITPVQKVNTQEGGAKRDSFFKKRDYED